jgi:hypothetical protein
MDCDFMYPVYIVAAGSRTDTFVSARGGGPVRLLKLHGSINWFCSASVPTHGETIYYVPTMGGWCSGESGVEDVHREAVADKVPFVVPPLTEKTQYFGHEAVRTMWHEAGRTLRSADTVFCLGYSLPKTDLTMRYFLVDNQPQKGTEFHLVNTDTGSARHFRSLLPECYKLNKTFVGEDAVPRFVQALIDGKVG